MSRKPRRDFTNAERRFRANAANKTCPVPGCTERLGKTFEFEVCFRHIDHPDYSKSQGAAKARAARDRVARRAAAGLRLFEVDKGGKDMRGGAAKHVTLPEFPWGQS